VSVYIAGEMPSGSVDCIVTSPPPHLVAYLAGAIDSDGTIGVRRLTYHMRVRGDARQPTYSERVMLKQVTPQIPELLKSTFGGSLTMQPPTATRGRLLYCWEATNRVAAAAFSAMIPYLTVKREQALNALALRASKDRPRSETHSYRDAAETRARWGQTMIRRLEVSAATIAERESIYQRALELNRVGIDVEETAL
jgi:hypothetical protein